MYQSASVRSRCTRFLALVVLCGAITDAPAQETRILTLREAIQTALNQNVDILLARLEKQAADTQVKTVADPFSLKLGVGSGLAYSTGFPMNVGGSGPSIVNAQASMTLYDRPLSLRVAEAKERARLPEISEKQKRADVALQVARLYLDAEMLGGARDSLVQEIQSLERVAELRRVEESEGRALPLATKRATAFAAGARYRLRNLDSSLAYAQEMLAFVLGMPAGVKAVPARESRGEFERPLGVPEATRAATAASTELERIETELAANQFRSRAAAAARWPVLKLVAQYSMFSRFNNYDDFYNRFERHNGQIGASFELPLFTGSATAAARSEADVEGQRLRLLAEQVRRKIEVETANLYREVEDARLFHEASRLELEAARENVSVLLARESAGKVSSAEMEQARAEESREWVDYYQSRAALETAMLELLHQTGELLAAFQ